MGGTAGAPTAVTALLVVLVVLMGINVLLLWRVAGKQAGMARLLEQLAQQQ